MEKLVKTVNVSAEDPREIAKFLKTAINELKKEIPELNRGCCGYLAYKIAELLISNHIFAFKFGTIMPLWSKTGLKAFEHVWIEIELYDGDVTHIIELNKRETNKKVEIEYIRQFYVMPALKESLKKEHSWAWGPSLNEENKSKIDEKLSMYMKEKTVHYARDCGQAGELIAENIRACSILSDKNIITPFTIEDKKELKNRWIVNKESTKQDMISDVDSVGIFLMSTRKWISFVGLLERYTFNDGTSCGKITKGKQIGCHSKVDCKHFIKK